MPVMPVMDSTREYSCAVTSRMSSGAEVRPTEMTACIISRGFMPRAMASSSASVAPTPAPSVGVKKPNQIPPSTSSTNTMMPAVLHRMVRRSGSSIAAAAWWLIVPAFAAASTDVDGATPSPTRCGCVLATHRM